MTLRNKTEAIKQEDITGLRLMMKIKYYVYSHIDPISKLPFYVGKGLINRVNSPKNRNRYWKAHVEFLNSKDLTYEVKIIASYEDDKEATARESLEIDLAIKRGCLLTNIEIPQKHHMEVIQSAIKDEFLRPLSIETISLFVKNKRKDCGLSQIQLSDRSGLGVRFIRDLEQGKPTLRLDKVNEVLVFFGSCLVPYLKPSKG